MIERISRFQHWLANAGTTREFIALSFGIIFASVPTAIGGTSGWPMLIYGVVIFALSVGAWWLEDSGE